MALYFRRPRHDEDRIGRGMPSVHVDLLCPQISIAVQMHMHFSPSDILYLAVRNKM